MLPPLRRLSRTELARLRDQTVAHYERNARQFWAGTKDHDVSQNIAALLRHVDPDGDDRPRDILDLGCGPGRDLVAFRDLGHRPIGLDAAPSFVRMARALSGCEVWLQDMLALALPAARFDGIFANAVLFHVPSQELGRVLGELRDALRPDGVLLASNPHGPDVEYATDDRYGCFLLPETWCAFVTQAGFTLLEDYFRPPGRPRQLQPWLATVWRRT